MDFCNSAPEPHLHSVTIYFSKRPGTVFCACVPFVLDCRVLQARFRRQNFTARFGSPDSAAQTPAARLRRNHPSLFHSPSPLFLSLPLSYHVHSPGLDFFDRGILCHEIAMSSGSGMVMGVMEKLMASFKAADW